MAGKVQAPLDVRFWSKVVKSDDGCWEWTAFRGRKGYGTIAVKRGAGPALAHRVSWVLHFGSIPDGMSVLHRCDNPPCVRPDHLFLGTLEDNNADMAEKGRFSRQKLTATEVREMRARFSGTEAALAARAFGVSYQHALDILKRRSWRHVA